MYKQIIALFGLLAFLTGCQSTSETVLEPSASEAEVKYVQTLFKDNDLVSVDDFGRIVIRHTIATGYAWDTGRINILAKEVACRDFYPLLQRGFVLKMEFVGHMGRTMEYDTNLCDQINTEEASQQT